MDRLATMTSFVTAVRCGSFTAAADQLGLSRPVVSKHIGDLERHLKVRLLARTTRAITPTEAGRRYYDVCVRVLSDLAAEEDALAGLTGRLEGKVAVVCPRWPGNFDVSEALSAFAKDNPDVHIELAIGGAWSSPYEFIAQGFDLCVQAGAIRDSRIKVKKIGDVEYVLVASPDYLSQRGTPRTPADLLDHDGLIPSAEPVWRFRVEGRSTPIKMTPRFASNSFPALRKAAIMGLGVAMVPQRIVLGEIASGALVRVLDDAALEATPVYAAYAPDGALPRKVRALLDFLSAWFRQHADGGQTAFGSFDPRPAGPEA